MTRLGRKEACTGIMPAYLYLYDAVTDGQFHQFRGTADSQFFLYLGLVIGHSFHTQGKVISNIISIKSFSEKAENLEFTVGQVGQG